jgi:hypothetical protein
LNRSSRDRGNILPGQRSDIARGGMQPIFAKLREGSGNQLVSGLFTFTGRRVHIHRWNKVNQSID